MGFCGIISGGIQALEVGKSQTRGMIYTMKLDLAVTGREKSELLPINVPDRAYFEFFSLLKNEPIDPRNLKAQAFANFVCTSPPLPTEHRGAFNLAYSVQSESY